MKKAKIYIPTKTAMQSGTKNDEKWVIEFELKIQASTLLWDGKLLQILTLSLN